MIGPYQENSIVCADCLDVMEQLPDNSIDLIIADPPYPGRKDMGGGKGNLQKWLAPMPRLTDKAIIKWSAMALPEAAASIPPEWKWQHTMVWHKPWTNARHWVLGIYPHWEALLILGIGGRRGELKHVQDVIWRRTLRAGMAEDVGHCMQTPESLMAFLILAFSLPGDLIFDPFVGSGTTLIVADRLGRRFLGCDCNLKFVEMAQRRLATKQMNFPGFDERWRVQEQKRVSNAQMRLRL